jgi:hypothetical protein
MDTQEAPIMRRKAAPLVALACVLIACIAAYLAVVSANRHGEEEAAKISAESLLYRNGRGDPVAVSFGAGGAEPLEFTLNGGLWRYTAIPDFPLTQSYVTRVTASLNTLKPDRVIEIGFPIGDYGLDSPKYILSASDGVSAPFVLLFGDRIGEFVYAMQPDGSVIYTVRASVADFLGVGLYDMVTLETLPVSDPGMMIALTLSRGDVVLSAAIRSIRGENVWTVATDGGNVRIDEISVPSDTGRSATRRLDFALAALSSPAFTSCADWRPDGGALSDYGLTDSALIVELTYLSGSGFMSEKSGYILRIGSSTPDNSGVFAQLDGSEFVNVLPLSDAQALADVYEALL